MIIEQHIATPKCINAFRDILDNYGRTIPKDLENLLDYSKLIPRNYSEHEIGFSNINVILNETRSYLLIQNVISPLFIKMRDPRPRLFNTEDYV